MSSKLVRALCFVRPGPGPLFISWALVGAIVAGCATNAPTANTCNEGQTMCAGACVDVTRDPANCGACAIACQVAEVCSRGVCAPGCAGGATACSRSCVDIKVDPTNCGACGKVCGLGEVCAAGTCSAACAPSQTLCVPEAGAPYCVSAQTDNANCGACRKACAQGLVCSQGTCGSACGQGETLCTPSAAVQDGGVQDGGAQDGGVQDGGAQDGGAQDGGAPYCAILKTDNANCGVCGNVCPQGKLCSQGTCASTCGQNQLLCTPDGGAPYCASTQTDNANCGACGNVCGQAQLCAGGVCKTLTITTKIYPIPQALLDLMPNNCGTNCFYGGQGQPVGFHWTDTGAGVPASVLVEFNYGVDCGAAVMSITLNGTAGATYSSNGGYCNCTSRVSVQNVSLNAAGVAAYAVGQVNTLRFNGTSSWQGLCMNGGWGTSYARVTVSYFSFN